MLQSRMLLLFPLFGILLAAPAFAADKGDFDGNGVPDLLWQKQDTRAVNVNYYGGPEAPL